MSQLPPPSGSERRRGAGVRFQFVILRHGRSAATGGETKQLSRAGRIAIWLGAIFAIGAFIALVTLAFLVGVTLATVSWILFLVFAVGAAIAGGVRRSRGKR